MGLSAIFRMRSVAFACFTLSHISYSAMVAKWLESVVSVTSEVGDRSGANILYAPHVNHMIILYVLLKPLLEMNQHSTIY